MMAIDSMDGGAGKEGDGGQLGPQLGNGAPWALDGVFERM